jgi:hypothetical protein
MIIVEDNKLELVYDETDSIQRQVAKDLQTYINSLSEAERKDMIQYIKTKDLH